MTNKNMFKPILGEKNKVPESPGIRAINVSSRPVTPEQTTTKRNIVL